MSSTKKVITIAVTTVALSLGSIGLATASNSKNSSKARVSVANTFGQHFGLNVDGPQFAQGNGELASVLSGLVTKGVLTQAQVDAINSAIATARTANQTARNTEHTARETLIATTIGIDVTTLQTRLAAGDSLATIAGSKTSALIAALVADQSNEIDAAVTAGRITSAQATALKANLSAHITAMVNGAGQMGVGLGHMGEGPGQMGEGPGLRDGQGNRGRGPGMAAPFAGGTTASSSSTLQS